MCNSNTAEKKECSCTTCTCKEHKTKVKLKNRKINIKNGDKEITLSKGDALRVADIINHIYLSGIFPEHYI